MWECADGHHFPHCLPNCDYWNVRFHWNLTPVRRWIGGRHWKMLAEHSVKSGRIPGGKPMAADPLNVKYGLFN